MATNGNTVNLLNEFYIDIPKYGFCFQTYAFLSRMRLLIETVKKAKETGISLIICERSIFTDREIFLDCLYDKKQVTLAEHTVYHHLWDFWVSIIKPYFNDIKLSFLYIRCDPTVALDHLHIRSRLEEKNVEIDYLIGLHNKHEQLYNNKDSVLQTLVDSFSTDHTKVMNINIIENNIDQATYFNKLDQWTDSLT
jgi:deoxyadenosine/deoxycytidine kinase